MRPPRGRPRRCSSRSPPARASAQTGCGRGTSRAPAPRSSRSWRGIPDGLGALNDLAVSYLLEGHADAASRLLDEVVAKGAVADQQAALVNLGELYATEGYVSAAQAYLDTARSLDASRSEPWYALALLADSRGDLERARGALREAIARDDGGAARAAFAYSYPEERVHLEALVAEQAGDGPTAAERWRTLAAGRFAALSAAAERHLAGE